MKKARLKRRKAKQFRLLCCGVALILCGTVFLAFAAQVFLRRMLKEYPLSNGCDLLLNTMNSAMLEMENSDILLTKVAAVDYAPNGTVRSIQCNVANINGFKTAYLNQLQQLMAKTGPDLTVSVPIGTLLGSEYTVGLGPELHFKVRYSTTFYATLKSEFMNAGINNILHRITMTVYGEIYIVIPWSRCNQTVSTDFVLAETVLAGQVPEAYTQVFDESGEVVDDIFNYNAELLD